MDVNIFIAYVSRHQGGQYPTFNKRQSGTNGGHTAYTPDKRAGTTVTQKGGVRGLYDIMLFTLPGLYSIDQYHQMLLIETCFSVCNIAFIAVDTIHFYLC